MASGTSLSSCFGAKWYCQWEWQLSEGSIMAPKTPSCILLLETASLPVCQLISLWTSVRSCSRGRVQRAGTGNGLLREHLARELEEMERAFFDLEIGCLYKPSQSLWFPPSWSLVGLYRLCFPAGHHSETQGLPLSPLCHFSKQHIHDRQ